MKEALAEAAIARDKGDWPVGCVITLDDKIIIRGRNRVYSSRNRLKHAEMDALDQVQALNFDRQDKERLVLYTTLEPCPMCFGAILISGIRHVVSGVDFDGSGISSYIDHIPSFFKRVGYKTTFVTGVLARDCAKMWLSGSPAKCMPNDGYKPPVEIDSLDKDIIKTYKTPSIGQSN